MSVTFPTELLTALEHAAWIDDHAYMPHRGTIDDRGVVTPPDTPDPRRLAVDVIEAEIRKDPRGVKRPGLTVRLFFILLIVAAGTGRVWISELYKLATGALPWEVQRDLGIVHVTARKGQVKTRRITAKQFYNLVDALRFNLDVDPDFTLEPDEVARRVQLLDDIKDAFLYATHVLPLTGTDVAIDESAVWSWMRGGARPKNMPSLHPHDEDLEVAAETQKRIQAVLAGADDDPDLDPLEACFDVVDAARAAMIGDGGTDAVDEDAAVPDGIAAGGSDTMLPGDQDPDSDTDDTADEAGSQKQRGKRCWWAQWGVKTHKSGKRHSYFGYALHALVRVFNRPSAAGSGDGSASKAYPYREPLLVEELAITAASTDIVDASLAMVRKRFLRDAPVRDLLGDRHYSYKQLGKWALPLWRMKVRPVLDLRVDDQKPYPYGGLGVTIIAGTPHLGLPEHLHDIPRPGKGARRAEQQTFLELISERQSYAFRRHKTAWSTNDGSPGGDGVTRWVSPVVAGTAGCPHVEGSIAIARQGNFPILSPDNHDQAVRIGKPKLTLRPDTYMKYHQEEY